MATIKIIQKYERYCTHWFKVYQTPRFNQLTIAHYNKISTRCLMSLIFHTKTNIKSRTMFLSQDRLRETCQNLYHARYCAPTAFMGRISSFHQNIFGKNRTCNFKVSLNNRHSLSEILTRALHSTNATPCTSSKNSTTEQKSIQTNGTEKESIQTDGTLGEMEMPRFFLAFTCNVCKERVKKTISRQAYEKGVVIVKCHGCDSNHLIADNLDWFKGAALGKNIEEIMKAKGETVTRSFNDETLEIIEKDKQ